MVTGLMLFVFLGDWMCFLHTSSHLIWFIFSKAQIKQERAWPAPSRQCLKESLPEPWASTLLTPAQLQAAGNLGENVKGSLSFLSHPAPGSSPGHHGSHCWLRVAYWIQDTSNDLTCQSFLLLGIELKGGGGERERPGESSSYLDYVLQPLLSLPFLFPFLRSHFLALSSDFPPSFSPAFLSHTRHPFYLCKVQPVVTSSQFRSVSLCYCGNWQLLMLFRKVTSTLYF